MKKSLLQVLTLALTILNLVLTAMLVFTCMPAISKTGALIDKVCEIIDLDVAGANGTSGSKDVTELEEVAVKFNGESTISLNLAVGADGESHLIKVGVTLVLDTKHADYKKLQPTVANSMSSIDGKIIEVITKYTVDQAINNKDEIRKEILGEIQNLFASKFIYDITFTDFITQ